MEILSNSLNRSNSTAKGVANLRLPTSRLKGINGKESAESADGKSSGKSKRCLRCDFTVERRSGVGFFLDGRSGRRGIAFFFRNTASVQSNTSLGTSKAPSLSSKEPPGSAKEPALSRKELFLRSKQPSRSANHPPGNTKQPPGSAKRRPLFTKRLTGSAKRRSFSRSGFPFDEGAYLSPRTNLPKQRTISHLRIK